MGNNDNTNTKENSDFTDFINFGYKISQDYKNYRRIYLELNIAFMSFFSLAIKFFTDFFVRVPCAYNLIVIGFILLLISTSINIFYNLLKHETKSIQPTWVHYRAHKDKIKTYELFKKYNQETTIDDVDLKQLYNTFKYQRNYFNLLKWTRRITLASILSFLICSLAGTLILLFNLSP
ncbi:MAG: hypothetical protein ACFFG0_22720 [Candidatus Thorarchaeota archaeon]